MNPIIEKKVLDHGLVALMRVDGSDEWPALAARKSYRSDLTQFSAEQNHSLGDYLMRRRHTTPLEFNETVWMMVMPIFVARQWVRHRTATLDEESLRYVEARNEFYVPELDRMQRQSTDNKQGSSSELVDDPEAVQRAIKLHNEGSYHAYQCLLAAGLSNELARIVLPLSTYTGWFWKCDLHNTFGLLRLRLDAHAQYEIRVYAEAMFVILKETFPHLVESFENHILNAVSLSGDEQKALNRLLFIQHGLKREHIGTATDFGLGKRRNAELLSKLDKIFGHITSWP